jgi:hypothetical protein
MPDNKSQHFVSQFYLRNFGHGDSRALICLFNRRTGLYVSHAPIKTQACADYFYERGDSVEIALGEMESRLGPLISSIIAQGRPPKWRSPDHLALLKFIVFQLSRTRFAKDAADEQNEKMVQKIDELWPGAFPEMVEQELAPTETTQMLLRAAGMNYHSAVDLRFKLPRNKRRFPSSRPTIPSHFTISSTRSPTPS